MANVTKMAVIFGVLVCFLQVSCAISSRPQTLGNVNVPAVMTVNSFQEGGSGGGPASCDGQYHSDTEFIVSLSSEWYAGGERCGKMIRIEDLSNLGITVKVVDECAGCDGEVGASPIVWHNFRLDPSLGEVKVRWSDLN